MTRTAKAKGRVCACGRVLDALVVPGVRGGSVTVYTCRQCDRLFPKPQKKKGR